jgi:hypothetical protein
MHTRSQIPDKPHSENLSRYSVPDGLMVIDDYAELHKSMVITAQKFAKGTRFGRSSSAVAIICRSLSVSLSVAALDARGREEKMHA